MRRNREHFQVEAEQIPYAKLRWNKDAMILSINTIKLVHRGYF
jgi:hypothetical protein